MYKKIEKNGQIFFVSTTGSMAIVNGKFYIDGKKAQVGQYTIDIDDGSKVIVNVGEDGQVISIE